MISIEKMKPVWGALHTVEARQAGEGAAVGAGCCECAALRRSSVTPSARLGACVDLLTKNRHHFWSDSDHVAGTRASPREFQNRPPFSERQPLPASGLRLRDKLQVSNSPGSKPPRQAALRNQPATAAGPPRIPNPGSLSGRPARALLGSRQPQRPAARALLGSRQPQRPQALSPSERPASKVAAPLWGSPAPSLPLLAPHSPRSGPATPGQALRRDGPGPEVGDSGSA
ncbi:nascent polypeptide-associated complex subunit alpha, muscle-specific form-like [Leopardus geoffroyi]|uniref:nascent polypeptide-associated complex subunit alpha, muscle-specific form-like n=1 Tax=Leopardus geoffroyi TaxID=46844 RepID=UPI001E266474|nr:nascent polypeptide-associated complex subunit alpha, muscle-specific form-like [Leopardus geoffroyi]